MSKRAIGVIVAALVVVAGVSAYLVVHQTQGQVPHIAQTTYKGPLHTQGTTIMDARNRPVRFFSFGENSLKPNRLGTYCYLSPDQHHPNYYSNVQDWGFNTVYLAFTWGSLEPTAPTVNPDGTLTHRFDPGYLRTMDNAIKQYNRHGVSVVLKVAPKYNSITPQEGKKNCAGHGMPSWLEVLSPSVTVGQSACNFISNIKDSSSVPGPSPLADFGDMWRALMAHYADNPGVVGADMLNEPYPQNYPDCPGYDLPRLFQIVGAKIRLGNPNCLLMFEETGTAGAAAKQFVLTGPIPFSNSVYVFHLYASGWATPAPGQLPYSINRAAEPALENVWNHAGTPGWGIPIWIQEFNSLGYNVGNTGSFWSQSMDHVMAFSRQHGLSYGVSSYSGPNGVVNNHTGQLVKPILAKLAEGLGPLPGRRTRSQ
jgi:hypothetical protein